MNAKVFFQALLIFVLTFPLFTACSDDEHTGEAGVAEQGLFVFNTGNQSSSLNGSLSFIDKKNDTTRHNLFMTINNRSLGMTVQDGVILGEYLYIAVSESNTIEVVNKNSLESIIQLQPTSSQGSSPRDIVTDGRYVYVSMYSGHISRINPSTLSIDKTIAVGPNPEEMAITNGALYVVNSDGLNYNAGYINGKSVSKIDLSTWQEKKIAVGLNPTKIGADQSGNLLILCMGDYGANPASIWKINNKDQASDLKIPASMMIVDGNTLYVINAPWGATEVTYRTYNTTNGQLIKSAFISRPVDSPAGIAIDPLNERIYISSYSLVGGYASYSTPGYVFEYTSDGTWIQKHEAGVGPCNMLIMN